MEGFAGIGLAQAVISNTRRTIAYLLRKSGNMLYRTGSRIYESPQKSVTLWFADHGDETLRLDYELDETSLVFDVGGYKGQWTSDICAMYCCSVHVFEPVEEFAEKIKKRFSRNRRVVVHQFGLADKTHTVKIGLDQDSSSVFKPGKRLVEAKLVRAADFMRENDIQMVDLMKINIEGGEYDLLDHLIDTGYVVRIRNIQVQFHDFVPAAEHRMKKLKASLAQSHYLTYQYPFVWENWHIKNNY